MIIEALMNWNVTFLYAIFFYTKENIFMQIFICMIEFPVSYDIMIIEAIIMNWWNFTSLMQLYAWLDLPSTAR